MEARVGTISLNTELYFFLVFPKRETSIGVKSPRSGHTTAVGFSMLSWPRCLLVV
jgi:hypothetical protein